MRKLIVTTLLLIAALAAFGQDEVYAYIIDASNTPTNVRNAPNGKVVERLSQDESYVVTLREVKNKWWRVDSEVLVEGDDAREIYLKGSKTGYWLHYSVLEFSVAGDPTDCLRTSPSHKAKAVKMSPSTELSFHPLAINGQWVKVVTSDGRSTGWMHRDKICSNPLTTCP